MVGGGRVQFCRELGATKRGELVGVELEQKPIRASREENASTFGYGVDALFAEYIGESCQPLARDPGNQLFDQQLHVGFPRSLRGTVLERDLVRAEKSGHDAQR